MIVTGIPVVREETMEGCLDIPIGTPALTFIEATHTYLLDGEIPSTTAVLDDNRLRMDWQLIPNGILHHARWRGRAVHIATHYHDEGTLDPASVHEEIAPYLEAWKAFLADRRVVLEELEVRYAHPVFRYGGQLDRIVRAPGRRLPIVCDLKTGDEQGVGFQLAAYAELYRHAKGLPISPERWSVRLIPDRRPPYIVSEYREASDWRTFRSALDLTFARQAQGKPWRAQERSSAP